MELKYKQSDNITTEKAECLSCQVWVITPDHESAEEELK